MYKILFFLCFMFSQSIFAQDDFLNEFESEYTSTAINDPFETYNRFMSNVNWGIYDYVFSPALESYNAVTPLGLRIGIYNFFDNLASPLRFLSQLLTLHFKEAGNEFARFSLNSTFGIGGILDIATPNGLYSKRSDFGITFGRWGLDGEFYFVLPLLGPSNFRDILAIPLNALAYPATYIDSFWTSSAIYTLKEFNYTARHKDTIDTLRRDGLDSYILMRNAYEQFRNELIKE
ncbi:MAG: VacJ family lipoprotein [Helicobacter sp.]|uniref:MlaA family lipoprotein n=1 Tax=Helicobacter sp. TaxID=218 RepID=UPI002A827BA1|nr:VacJ family lipoprotein [Helicobacter sp.]MDY4425910.1 VacJ family lipoprotein [Helicobacter sp.]